jgi:BirA family biotin operon repressor/biotin-[acetyl-CoA-carboxylase] ligase
MRWIECEKVDSTNRYLRALLLNGEVSRAIVWALEQDAGRGRLGRVWLSPQGGLYISLCTPVKEEVLHYYGMAVGLACAEYLHQHYSQRILLKWPNDLIAISDNTAKYAPEAKLGGILSEYVGHTTQGPHVIVGLGLNVNAAIKSIQIPTELLELGDQISCLHPISLREIVGHELALKSLVQQIVNNVISMWDQLDNDPAQVSAQWLKRWKAMLHTIGQRVCVVLGEQVCEGVARDVSTDLALIIETDSTTLREIQTGDCIHLRPARH